MIRTSRILGAVACLQAVITLNASELAWPEFRGPTGQGIAPAGAKVPLTWGEEKNVKWKTPIHGRAWSSPISDGKQIWLSTATTNGVELSAVCVDFATGKIIHDLKLFQVAKPQYAHPFNSYASPTPVMEEESGVYDVRSAGDGVSGCGDGEGDLGAARFGVQSFSRRGIFAGHLQGFIDHAF